MSENNMAAGRGAVSAFANHCEWTGASANDRENWLRARRSGIGGSDVAAIMGRDPRRGALEVYVEKTSDGPPTDEQKEIFTWGHLLEPVILKEFSQRSGRIVRRGGKLLRATRAPHHLITLDGVQLTKPPPRCKGPGIAEVKTTGFGEEFEPDGAYDEGEEAEAILPLRVQIQMQWQMAVTGAEWGTCIWLPLLERKLQWVDMRAEPRVHAMLRDVVDEFWQQHVLARVPPPPDGSESSKRALARLFPGQGDDVFQLLEGAKMADEYRRLGDMIAVLDKRKKYLRNVLAATMGEARNAVLDDGRYWGASLSQVKEKLCPHCSGVVGTTGGHRSFRLYDPRKKPFYFNAEPRALAVNLEAEDAAVAKALSESIVGAPAPSNDPPEKETA